jgi:glucose 1-dehydrogenase
MKGLGGRRVLITGAASGIGRATALRFAAEGATVAVNYLGDPEPAEAFLEQLNEAGPNGGHMLAPADVADEDAVDSLFAGVVQAFDGLDILINNAGIKLTHQPHEVPIDEFDQVMAVNLRGAFLCAQAAIQHFLDTRRRGAIVTVSSVQAAFPVNDDAIAYVMSKSGLAGMTRVMALRYGRDGIRVNAVGPGAVMTPMNAIFAENPQELRRMERAVPLGRIGTADEIAAAIAFLASDEASYVTGQTLYVDGGLMAGRLV